MMHLFASSKPLKLGKREGGITAEYELVDINELLPASMGQYTHPHTKAWAEKIKSPDAFVFVTGEYNHSLPGALKKGNNQNKSQNK